MSLSAFLRVITTALVTLLARALIRRLVLAHPLDKIPGPPPRSLIAGHFPEIFASDGWEFHRSLAKNYGGKLFGLLRQRILYIHDPKALHHVLVKEQHTYEESIAFISTNKVIFGDGLLSTMGDHHKKQRKMLNPVFSTVHMRKLTPTFFGIAYRLRDVLTRVTADNPQEVEMVSWITRAAMEFVGLAALGQSFDPLTEDAKEHPYVTALKLLGPLGRSLIPFRQIVLPFFYKYKIGTPRIQRLLVGLFPMKKLHQMRDVVDVMHQTARSIFDSRKKALEDGSAAGDHHDVLSILMSENAKASLEDKLPDGEVIAQISTFMFAAMDTTSSALLRLLCLLANHPDAQETLRAEIRAAKEKDDQPDYDQLASLPYLDAVCRESLRMYPPVPTLARESRKDGVLPLSEPIKTVDGHDIEEIFVPKDTLVIFSIQAINTDPAIWGSDANEWKPERWLSPLPDSVAAARVPGVYSHTMSFLGGGRSCVGFKFAEMEMKVMLFVLVDMFNFCPGKDEILWNMLGITTPMVDRNQLRPSMPLTITRAM